MADNGNDPNKQGEREGKINASTKKEQGAVNINNIQAHVDEIEEGPTNINDTSSVNSMAVGNATAGNNQQLDDQNLKKELAPRTTPESLSGMMGDPNKGTTSEDTITEIKEPEAEATPESISAFKEDSSDLSSNDDPSSDGASNGAADQSAAKADTEIQATAGKDKESPDPQNTGKSEGEDDKADNFGFIKQLLGEYSATIGAGNLADAKAEKARVEELKKAEDSGGESETEEAKKAIDQNNSSSSDLSQGAGSRSEEAATSTEEPVATAENTNAEATTTEQPPAPAGPLTQSDQLLADMDGLEGEVDATQKKEDDKNGPVRKQATDHGLDVGRSVGYGAKIKDNGSSVEEFGTDEADSLEKLQQYRDSEHASAQSKSEIYYDAYVIAYNEGRSEGIVLKQEADVAARQKALEEEKKRPEYQIGAILGLACGAAAAKGETDIDAAYTLPNGGGEKVIQGPLAPVRASIMSDKRTPDGLVGLQEGGGQEEEGEALARAFMQHYNIAQQEVNQQRQQGPEKDVDYQKGYDRGLEIGKNSKSLTEEQKAEKQAFIDIPEEAAKPQKQQKIGFFAGYNKGIYNAEKETQDAKQAEKEKRNNDPVFMSGYATGNMQGFLKALLVPSGKDLAEAIAGTSRAKLKEAGIPDFFPIPDAIRANMQAKLGVGGDATVQQLIQKELFSQGWLKGFNKGFLDGEQSRASFKRQQFKLHPDYQQALKTVYIEKDVDGNDVKMNMGRLKAKLGAEQKVLQAKEAPTEAEQQKLSIYTKALAGLDAEVNKQSEYYQRGVLEQYNIGLGEEEKKKKAAEKAAVFNDPDYYGGWIFGKKVGEKVFETKQKIKDLRRNRVDITAQNAKLNALTKKTRDYSKSKGNMFFRGYARGYSDTLREKEKKANESDLGNKLDEGQLQKATDAIKAGADVGVFNKLAEVKASNTEISAFYDKEGGKEAREAFKLGASEGYRLCYTGDPDPEKNISNEAGALEEYTKKVKAKATAAGEDSKAKAYFFMKGFAVGEGKNCGYGIPKGVKDATEFKAGLQAANAEFNGAASGMGEPTANTVDNTSKVATGTDAFKQGYKAGKKELRFKNFRDNIIQAQRDRTPESTEAETTPANYRAHTEHATKEGDIADNNALMLLETSYDSGSLAAPVANQEPYVEPELKAWQKKLGFISGLKEQLGDKEEVQQLQVPSRPVSMMAAPEDIPAGELEARDKGSTAYQQGHLEGLQLAQRIKSGIAILNQDVLAESQSQDYIKGYAEGKEAGNTAAIENAQAAAQDGAAYKDLATLQEHVAITQADVLPEEKRGYTTGFFSEYWKKHDTEYGHLMGVKQTEGGGAVENEVQNPVTSPTTVTIHDQTAFNEGFTSGCEAVRSGVEGGSTERGADENLDTETALKRIVQDVAWKNGVIALARETEEQYPALEFLKKISLINSGDGLYSRYASLPIVKTLLDDGKTSDPEVAYVLPNLEPVGTLGDILGIEKVTALLSDLPLDKQQTYAQLFQETYASIHEAIKSRASVEMTNLTMTMAIDGRGIAENGVRDNVDQEIGELMEQLEALFSPGNQADFSLDSIELIDRFYELERELQDHQNRLAEQLEDLQNHQEASNYDKDAPSTLAASEILAIREELNALEEEEQGADAAKREELQDKRRELERALRDKGVDQRTETKKEQVFQRDWEELEEDSKEEIYQIQQLLEDNIGFEVANQDILDQLNINLETSKKKNKGERIYQDLSLLDNLTISGALSYEEASAFDVLVTGEGRLSLQPSEGKVKVENIDTEWRHGGFRFAAKGLEHTQATQGIALFGGNLVTPRIEGGPHEGVQLELSYHDFVFQKGTTMKEQLKAQINKLKGG